MTAQNVISFPNNSVESDRCCPFCHKVEGKYKIQVRLVKHGSNYYCRSCETYLYNIWLGPHIAAESMDCPNWFNRLMQKWIFGFKWEKVT